MRPYKTRFVYYQGARWVVREAKGGIFVWTHQGFGWRTDTFKIWRQREVWAAS